LVALLVLVALVGFGFQTQAFAGTCLKTLCWQLDNYPTDVIKASVDCNLKSLKTKLFAVTGSYEFSAFNQYAGHNVPVVAPMDGTLQTIWVWLNGNSYPLKKPVMTLEGSVLAGFFDYPFVYNGFFHIIFDDCDLNRGYVSGGFEELNNFGIFYGEPISRIDCKRCPSNNLPNNNEG
jgi:hypothetical protein